MFSCGGLVRQQASSPGCLRVTPPSSEKVEEPEDSGLNYKFRLCVKLGQRAELRAQAGLSRPGLGEHMRIPTETWRPRRGLQGLSGPINSEASGLVTAHEGAIKARLASLVVSCLASGLDLRGAAARLMRQLRVSG